MCLSFSHISATRPTNLSLYDLIVRTNFGDDYRSYIRLSAQETFHFYGTRTFIATHTQVPSAGIYSEPKQNLVQFSQPTFKMHLIFSFRLSYSLSSNIRRAQVKVGLINLCKGLFSLNARIYSKTCLKRTPYIPETWTNGK